MKIGLLVLLLILSGCYQEDVYDFTELAMDPEMSIVAKNKNGVVVIKRLTNLKRQYCWNDYEEIRTLRPRKERWFGMLGAYDPAKTFFMWPGEIRIVAEDSRINFSHSDEMNKWLIQSSDVLDWTYSDDGLIVGFSKDESRRQVNIEVYQLLLNGEKPKGLLKGESSKLTVDYSQLSCKTLLNNFSN